MCADALFTDEGRDLGSDHRDLHLWLLFHVDLRQTARLRALVDFLSEKLEAEPGVLGLAAS